MVADDLGTIQLCSCKRPCGSDSICHTCHEWLNKLQLSYPRLCRGDGPWAYVALMKVQITQEKIWWRNIMDDVNRTR